MRSTPDSPKESVYKQRPSPELVEAQPLVSDSEFVPMVRRHYLDSRNAFHQGRRRYPARALGCVLWRLGRTTPTRSMASSLETASAIFFLAFPLNSSMALKPNDPARFRRTQMAYYLLDDWKVNSKLTLNIGLRYEFNEIPKELSGLTPVFDPKLGNGAGWIALSKAEHQCQGIL